MMIIICTMKKNMLLLEREHNKQYRLGDKIHVKLIRIDEERTELDFTIVDTKE